MRTISVIIPVKNRANLLPATLDNLLSQTMPAAEIIVVDDGSTDHLHEVIDKYRHTVIFTKNTGKGPGAARNTGFKISTGEYIQFFDSDDLMSKEKLEVQYKLLSESGSGMVYCPHVKAYQTEQGKWIQQDVILYYYPLSKKLRYDQWLIRGACMITQACLFDRNIFKETGLWRTDLMPHEDLEFLFRIGKVVHYPVHTNEVAVIYRQHGNQITDKMVATTTRILDQVNAWMLIQDNMKNNYTLIDSMIMKGNIWNTLKSLKDSERPAFYDKQMGIEEKIAGFFLKAINKYNRTRTKSDWKLLHGISRSSEVFNRYLKQL